MNDSANANEQQELTPSEIEADNAAFLRAAAATAAAEETAEAGGVAIPIPSGIPPQAQKSQVQTPQAQNGATGSGANGLTIPPVVLEDAVASVDAKILAAVVAQQAAAGVSNQDAHAAIGLAAGELAAAGFSGAGIGTVLASIVGVKGYVPPSSTVKTLAQVFDGKTFQATHSTERAAAIVEAAHLLGCKIG